MGSRIVSCMCVDRLASSARRGTTLSCVLFCWLYNTHMKKKNSFIIIGFIAVLVIAMFLFWQEQEEERLQEVDSNVLSEKYETQANTPSPEIDYSTLEKDRLYTEEEGMYENLGEVGKRLLREVLVLPECMENPDGNYCYEYEQYAILNSSIVAFKDGVLLIDVPNGKGGAFYKIYDLKQNKYTGKQMWHFDTNAKNKDLVIYVYDDDTSGQNLFYYRPGRRSFALVPNSKISPTESYWYNVGMGAGLPDITFKNNVFTISIFNKNQPWEAGNQSKKLREVTFNLDNIR